LIISFNADSEVAEIKVFVRQNEKKFSFAEDSD